jgi:DNA-binding transcriptional regulator GbsR (MarR family)
MITTRLKMRQKKIDQTAEIASLIMAPGNGDQDAREMQESMKDTAGDIGKMMHGRVK